VREQRVHTSLPELVAHAASEIGHAGGATPEPAAAAR
jgi:hypothetical protein